MMEVSGQLHTRDNLPPRKNSGTTWAGGWLGSGASSNVLEKRKISWPCRDSNFISSSL